MSKTRTELKDSINLYIYTNITGNITAVQVNTLLNYVVDGCANLLDDAALLVPNHETAYNHASYVIKTNNLSDLSNVSTARTNLNLGSAALLTAGTSVGNAVVVQGDGFINSSLLPPLAITSVKPVADIAARNALVSGALVQEGDVAIVANAGSGSPASYILDATNAWIQFETGAYADLVWQRASTIISPINVGDSLNMGTGRVVSNCFTNNIHGYAQIDILSDGTDIYLSFNAFPSTTGNMYVDYAAKNNLVFTLYNDYLGNKSTNINFAEASNDVIYAKISYNAAANYLGLITSVDRSDNILLQAKNAKFQVFAATNYVGIGDMTNAEYSLSFNELGGSIGVNTSTLGEGTDFEMYSGNALAGSTNKWAGNINIRTGAGTGNSSSGVYFYTAHGGSSGTATTPSNLALALKRGKIANNSYAAAELHIASDSTSSPRGIMSSQHNVGTDGAIFHGRKSRGTLVTPTVITTGDMLARFVGSGYDGSNYLEMAAIEFESAGTIASTRIATNIAFYTATNAATSVLTEALRITEAQNIKYKAGQIWYPSADSTTALMFNKANTTTNIVTIDSTNARVGIGVAPGVYKFNVGGDFNATSINSASYIYAANLNTGFSGSQIWSDGFYANSVFSWSFGCVTNSDKSIGVGRNRAANAIGRALTIQAGGSYLTSTDKLAGDLILSSGISTGSGTGDVIIKSTAAGLSGTSDSNPSEVWRWKGSGNVLFGSGKTWYPSADGIAALTFAMADATTPMLIIDSANSRLESINFVPITDDTYYLGRNSSSAPKAWKGVVLKDTTNSTYYRIEIINGVVTATAL